MKTKALRLYGKNDLRLEEFELPPITENELLVRIVCDSLCMSSYKAVSQGAEHKRVPDDVANNPIIIGHEFCGEIIEVGKNITGLYRAGQKFSIQPAMRGTYSATGYTFQHLGGNMQYGIIPECYTLQDAVLPYEGDAWFHGSLAEPLSCVIGTAHANYHTILGEYNHIMGIKENGKAALLAGAGPMGFALIDYLLHCDRKPQLLVVTDIDDTRLARAAEILTVEEAEKNGVKLHYVNTGKIDNPVKALKDISDGDGYDDVFVFAPVTSLVEQGGGILGHDGCLNFFAGPSNTDFSARLNFYDVHYNATHIVGTSGGNISDMREALELSAKRLINPSILVTHIGGLDSAQEATLNLAKIPGGKKLIYNHVSLPLTAIEDFKTAGETEPIFRKLDEICQRHSGLWCLEAEQYLLSV